MGASVIGGDVTGGIEITGRPNQTEIVMENVNIQGSLLGDVTVHQGYIRSLTIDGDIGTPASPVDITVVNRGITFLTASAIYADVQALGIGRLAALSGDFVGSITLDQDFFFSGYGPQTQPSLEVAGDFIGNINARSVVPNGSNPALTAIRIDGDLDGEWVLTNNIQAPIVVAGSLTSAGSITADFIESQVILNAANDAGTWDGDVTVLRGSASDITLAGPNYTNTPFQIGGGAVGLAPFNIHGQICQPVNGASLSGLAAVVSAFNIQHYGPITGATGTDPVTISHKTIVRS